MQATAPVAVAPKSAFADLESRVADLEKWRHESQRQR